MKILAYVMGMGKTVRVRGESGDELSWGRWERRVVSSPHQRELLRCPLHRDCNALFTRFCRVYEECEHRFPDIIASNVQ
jgi:hypothetical protein